jgi:hypothetical protein
MADRKDVIGKCYTYRGLKFYAQNGFVCLHDEDTGEFFVLTRREFLERAQALGLDAAQARRAGLSLIGASGSQTLDEGLDKGLQRSRLGNVLFPAP